MESVLSRLSASVTELKSNPNSILEEANGDSVAILKNNKPFAYLISPKEYEDLLVFKEKDNV